MKKLLKSNFTPRKERFYSFKTADFEICIEKCMNGFDVAIYDPRRVLLEPKECLGADGYGDDPFGIFERRSEEWEKALKIANRFYEKHG